MGTLFDQPPRSHQIAEDAHIDEFFQLAVKQAEQYNLSFDQVMRVHEFFETVRRTNVRVDDGDAKDEQLAGFGEIARELVENTKPRFDSEGNRV